MTLGLDTAAVQFLCAAKSLKVDFTRVAMIGRQSFYPDVPAVRRVFSVLGINQDAEEFVRRNKFGEPFFSLLGANEITSLDYSPYEGATVVHDMNLPIPADLRGRFSVVFDGGTIEHVFNIYQALKNCMEMVQVGGHFTQVNVANNFMGHGFWQFSPEMVFRAFSPANGYEIVAVLLHEVVPGGGWWIVPDPDQVHSRVELCNSAPTYILTVAKRVALADIFARPPQQSDYVTAWERFTNTRPPASNPGGTVPCSRPAGGPTEWWRNAVAPFKSALKSVLQRLSLLRPIQGAISRSYYRRIREDNLLRGKLT
jgi:hypothetical protein